MPAPTLAVMAASSRKRQAKVTIVGAGSVGATIAYACLIRGVANSVTLYDVNADKTRAEVLDLNQGIQFVPMAAVTGSDDIAVTADSDIVVVTAGAKQRPGQTRLELAGINVELCRKLVPQLVELSPNALLLLVTNPVDVLTYAATKFSGLPHHRVVGSGTVLDSSRLRVLLAQHTGVAVQSIHAYIVGEHGDSELPLWSSAAIGPIPVSGLDRTRAEAARRRHPRRDRRPGGPRGRDDHPREGCDELRDRPVHRADHRGHAARRGPGPARLVAARRPVRHQRHLPVTARRWWAPTASAPSSMCRCPTRS